LAVLAAGSAVTPIQKVLDMMDYIDGYFFFTRAFRRAKKTVSRALGGTSKYTGVWVKQEAAQMLKDASVEFQLRVGRDAELQLKLSKAYQEVREDLVKTQTQKSSWRIFAKKTRFERHRSHCVDKLKKGKEVFEDLEKLVEKLKGSILKKAFDEGEELSDGGQHVVDPDRERDEAFLDQYIAENGLDDPSGAKKVPGFRSTQLLQVQERTTRKANAAVLRDPQLEAIPRRHGASQATRREQRDMSFGTSADGRNSLEMPA